MAVEVLAAVSPDPNWWLLQMPAFGWVLALVPSALILHHVMYLRLIKRHSIIQDDGAWHSLERQHTNLQNAIQENYSTAKQLTEQYFSNRALILRYATPFLLNAVIGAGLFSMMRSPEEWMGVEADPLTVNGLRYGALGAYAYVLLTLGQRTFLHDVTTGLAVWCAIQMIVGPVLAVAAGHVFLTPPKEAGEGGPLASAIGLYLLAGFAPRFVADSAQELLRRLWFPGGGAGDPFSRQGSLSLVQGMTPSVAERLAEEGIYNVKSLAAADPLKLLRNTPYDHRLLLVWIDEAILISTLPQQWHLLESEGITGSIDLAWLAYRLPSDGEEEEEGEEEEAGDEAAEAAAAEVQQAPGAGAPPVAVAAAIAPAVVPAAAPAPEAESPPAIPSSIAELAKRVKLEPDVLADTIVRLSEDAQVLLVWALYQNGHLADENE